MPGSPNKIIINSLQETIKQRPDKLDTAKLYDLIQKMNQDLNKTYDALFDGPLPAVSGEKLDLTSIPKEKLPADVAFIDSRNLFIEDQKVFKVRPQVQVEWNVPGTPGGGSRGRFAQATDGQVYFSNNLQYDGTNWVTDIAALGSMMHQSSGYSLFYTYPVGGPLTLVGGFNPNAGGVFQVGPLATAGNLNAGDFTVANNKGMKGGNAAGTTNLSMVVIDVNNLVQLGSNPVGATTGEGNVSIPRAVNGDLPVAGATRNGILILDKTNGRLCYYVNNLRYWIPIGTAF